MLQNNRIPRNGLVAIGTALIGLLMSTAWAQTSQPATQPAKPVYAGTELVDLMKRVMDFQVRAYGPKPDRMWLNWQAAPFWSGVMACYKSTGDDAFRQATLRWGQGNNWKVGPRTFHADDVAIGQAYLDLYMTDKQPEIIADVKSRIDQYFTKESVTRAEVGHGSGPGALPWSGRNVWWWCDALFMAPPVMARLSEATGDPKYIDLMDKMYWDTTAYLFDESEGLFFRDDSYFPEKKKSPTGKKIFWGRGNGWVYGGLVRTIDAMPANDPRRQKFVELYRKMTDAIVKYQQPDGLWRASVNEPTWISPPESSSSGFFTFGLLAGINRGWLDREKYLPIALKGWDGLCGIITPEGGIGYAQKVGASPEPPAAGSFMDYAQGAFLLAASELNKSKPTAAETKR